MATKTDKKEHIRKQIIDAACIYRDHLAGKAFLYVTGDKYFEVVFQTDRFMHLTGVNSKLRAQDFYDKAKESELTTGQIYFDPEHPYHGAKKKLPCLKLLPSLTNSLVCVVKDIKTLTLTYKIGVTNLNFTIGLTENLDFEGNKINDCFCPAPCGSRIKPLKTAATRRLWILFSRKTHLWISTIPSHSQTTAKRSRIQSKGCLRKVCWEQKASNSINQRKK